MDKFDLVAARMGATGRAYRVADVKPHEAPKYESAEESKA